MSINTLSSTRQEAWQNKLTLQNELNQAIFEFRTKEQNLNKEIKTISEKNTLKPRTEEELNKIKESGELEKRLKQFLTINGNAITIKQIKIEGNIIKTQYEISLDNQKRNIRGNFQIVGEMNNNYLQYYYDSKEKEISSIELYEKDNKKYIQPTNKEYQWGTIYDINITRLPSKNIDIIIKENPRLTEQKRKEKILKYNLNLDEKNLNLKDESLENTQITALWTATLSQEIQKEQNEYFRAIFIKENGKYREIGKIYFDAQGNVDTKKTWTQQRFTVLNTPIIISIDTKNNTFTLKNIDTLKSKIQQHRNIISTYITNSEFGDYTIFTGFNKTWPIRKQTKLIGLNIIDDTYTLQRWKQPTDKIYIGFDEKNELTLKNASWSIQNKINIEAINSIWKEKTYIITKDATNKKLSINNDKEKNLPIDQISPLLEKEPKIFKDAVYEIKDSIITYYTPRGKLITQIPIQKIENNDNKIWKLQEEQKEIDYEEIYKKLNFITSTNIQTKAKNINILEQDIYQAFASLAKNKLPQQTKSIKVLSENNTYTYYKISQKKPGEAIVFEEDTKLYDEASKILTTITEKIETLYNIETTTLIYRDKKEKVDKSFSQFVWGCGRKHLPTEEKISYLQNEPKTTLFTKTLLQGNTTNLIQSFDITFFIDNKGNPSVKEKNITINETTYTIKLQKDQVQRLSLVFDDKE